ncbi:hypothetical protein LP420_06945 [Massilia sp. B-10]|nr:hypothetical protein LP420_06945 [Massilia sp. B-10]
MVSVLGQVSKPGRYPVDGKQGLIDILALVDGVLPEGGDIVYLIRQRDGKSSKETVDLVKMMRAGRPQAQPGPHHRRRRVRRTRAALLYLWRSAKAGRLSP